MTAPTCSRCSAALPDVIGKGIIRCPACKHPNELRTAAPADMPIDTAVAVTLAAREHGQDEGYLRGYAAGVAEERARREALALDFKNNATVCYACGPCLHVTRKKSR